uniref:beta strand repeat-containing protein n=1 Tax=Lacinutrix algicola TaxID=342954 RepID=UPI000B1B206B
MNISNLLSNLKLSYFKTLFLTVLLSTCFQLNAQTECENAYVCPGQPSSCTYTYSNGSWFPSVPQTGISATESICILSDYTWNYNFEAKGTIYIAPNITVNATFQKISSLIVEGTLNITNNIDVNNGVIDICNQGVLNTAAINISTTSTINNAGDVVINTPNGITFNSGVTVNNFDGANFVMNGGSGQITLDGTISNCGIVRANTNGVTQFNGNSQIYNVCSFYVENDLQVDRVFTNDGLIVSGGTLRINNGIVTNNGIFDATNVIVDGTSQQLVGNNSTSLLVASGFVTLTNGGDITDHFYYGPTITACNNGCDVGVTVVDDVYRNYVSTEEYLESCGGLICSAETDFTDPTITCPNNIIEGDVDGNSMNSIDVPDPIYEDNCLIDSLTWAMVGATTGNSSATGENVLGTQVFNLGVTIITYTVTDVAGNSVSCSFNVTINNSDDDNDGVSNANDICNGFDDNLDNDNDGVPDGCDLDDDNDGILDTDECPISDSGFDGPISVPQSDFDITSSGSAGDDQSSHVLNSITIGGIEYGDFKFPDAFDSNFGVTVPVTSSNQVTRFVNGAAASPSIIPDGKAVYDALILSSFQTNNLNSFQQLSSKDFRNDSYDLLYNTPIISRGGVFVSFVERDGNNPAVITALDSSGNPIGSPISVANNSHYNDTGVALLNTQNAEMAIYAIDDLIPIGTSLSGLRVGFSNGSSSDSPDGKIFIIGASTFSFCDTDGDSIPDVFDTDSDNDGCPDALEGGDNILATNVVNGMLTGTVDPVTGVPNNVNVNNGQTIGTSIDNTQFDSFNQCDSDGDGVIDANDICNGFDDKADIDGDTVPDGCDLDNDNDGILDVDECSPSKTMDIIILSTNLTYTASGSPGNIGDTARYANVGTYEGTAVDLRITVLNNSDTTNLVADLSGTSFDPGGGQPIIYYPIYLSSTGPATTGFANFDFEFLINGTNTLIEVPANMVFQDIDDTTPGEFVEFNKEDILNFEVTTTTSLVVGNNVSLSSFGTSGNFLKVTSTSNAPAANDENLWFNIQMPFIDEFDITFSKRQFDTGYLFNTSVFGNPTTITQVTPGCTADYDNDGIPDYLDVDSDNDGCPDAIEGAATNIGLAQLNPDGSINTTANGGVSTTGVPDLANSGAGQATGSSQNDAILATECTVAITIGDVTVDEGAGTASVPVTIDGVSSVDTVVAIVTTSGTAGTSDYRR